MSDRRGSSRTLGASKQCAVYERGGRRCVWCQRALRAPRSDGGSDTVTASIDHYSGDATDHSPSNVLPSCRTCNAYRTWPEVWPMYLRRHKQTVGGAESRAREQLAAPLDYRAGRELAERWHPDRARVVELCRKNWIDRRAGRLPPVESFP